MALTNQRIRRFVASVFLATTASAAATELASANDAGATPNDQPVYNFNTKPLAELIKLNYQSYPKIDMLVKKAKLQLAESDGQTTSPVQPSAADQPQKLSDALMAVYGHDIYANASLSRDTQPQQVASNEIPATVDTSPSPMDVQVAPEQAKPINLAFANPQIAAVENIKMASAVQTVEPSAKPVGKMAEAIKKTCGRIFVWNNAKGREYLKNHKVLGTVALPEKLQDEAHKTKGWWAADDNCASDASQANTIAPVKAVANTVVAAPKPVAATVAVPAKAAVKPSVKVVSPALKPAATKAVPLPVARHDKAAVHDANARVLDAPSHADRKAPVVHAVKTAHAPKQVLAETCRKPGDFSRTTAENAAVQNGSYIPLPECKVAPANKSFAQPAAGTFSTKFSSMAGVATATGYRTYCLNDDPRLRSCQAGNGEGSGSAPVGITNSVSSVAGPSPGDPKTNTPPGTVTGPTGGKPGDGKGGPATGGSATGTSTHPGSGNGDAGPGGHGLGGGGPAHGGNGGHHAWLNNSEFNTASLGIVNDKSVGVAIDNTGRVRVSVMQLVAA